MLRERLERLAQEKYPYEGLYKKMSRIREKTLLLDVGNTRIKSAIIQGEDLHLNPPLTHTKQSAFTVCKHLLEEQEATSLYISSVLSADYEHSIKDYCHSAQIEVVFIQSTAAAFGLYNAYQAPKNLGVDRFVAMLGALDLGLSSEICIVVDAGTALTIDIIKKKGQHLGGIISPGLQTMLNSLHRNTQLDQQSIIDYSTYKDRYYANNTEDAIVLGTVNTFIAGIRYTLETIKEQLSSDVSIILTGGDAGLVAQGLPQACEIHSDLVLRGLHKVYNHKYNND